ncbi:MAG: hypothetical protein ACFFDN_34805 [Candidatus Hodarchaeota archaeon]
MVLTDTEFDDAILMPILCGLINFGFIGTISFLISNDLIITGVIAGICCLITVIIVYYIKSGLESKPTDFKIFEEKEAIVEIPFSKTEIGKISLVLTLGEREEIPARAFDPTDPPFLKGDKVIIKEFDGGIAEIKKSVNWEIKKLKKERKKE